MVNIVVKLCIEGIHRWEECNVEEAYFLKNDHRHVFEITCKKQVTNSDREIEIIAFKHKITNWLKKHYYKPELNSFYFNKLSCEQLAEIIALEFDLFYCKVLEDGENGAEYVESKNMGFTA